jgi:hypothetical protein
MARPFARTGNTPASHTPSAPFGGRAGVRGAALSFNTVDSPTNLPMIISLFPKFFRQNRFYSGKFRAYKHSSGIVLDFSNFEPKKTWPKKFQSENFCDFQLSRQKFSGTENFTAKKSTQFLIRVQGHAL